MTSHELELQLAHLEDLFDEIVVSSTIPTSPTVSFASSSAR